MKLTNEEISAVAYRLDEISDEDIQRIKDELKRTL